MWRLHRYYLRELLVNATLTFGVLFGIVLISLVARGIQRAKGGSLLDAATITVLHVLDAFPHLLPISFLIATVLTFARAANDREITAIRSAGISPRVPMTAAVLVGIVLSIAGSLTMHYLVPEAHFRKYRVIPELLRNAVMNMGLASSNDRVSIPGTGVTLTFAGREDRANGDHVRHDCWLYLSDELAGRFAAEGPASPILHVERVVIPAFRESDTAIAFRLEHVRNPLSGHVFRDMEFHFPSRLISEVSRRDERDEDIASDQLLSEVLRDLHEQPTAAKYTLNRRSCFALLPLLLGPIGFCIALAARDRGRTLALLLALLPLSVFYTGDVLAAKLLRATDHSEFGWLPAVLVALVGAPFCWRELRK